MLQRDHLDFHGSHWSTSNYNNFALQWTSSQFYMSFSELRNTRQSKGLKSYVNQSPETASSEAQVSSSSPQAVVQPQILDAPAHDGVNHGSFYSSLPPFMELRVSADSGRGLWNKTKVHPGTAIAQ